MAHYRVVRYLHTLSAHSNQTTRDTIEQIIEIIISHVNNVGYTSSIEMVNLNENLDLQSHIFTVCTFN